MSNQEAQTRINANGRVVIPAEFRRALGVKSGDVIVLKMEKDELRITTLRQRLARAQEMVRSLNKGGRKLSEELIAERREAAKRE